MLAFLKKYHIPVISWGLAVAVLSLMPTDRLPNPHVTNLDKAVHFTMYFIFSMLAFWSIRIPSNDWKKYVVIGFTVALYGFLMECCQKWFCTYRSFEWWDVASNATGALCSALIIGWNQHRKK